jgi:hypothetical protein
MQEKGKTVERCLPSLSLCKEEASYLMKSMCFKFSFVVLDAFSHKNIIYKWLLNSQDTPQKSLKPG